MRECVRVRAGYVGDPWGGKRGGLGRLGNVAASAWWWTWACNFLVVGAQIHWGAGPDSSVLLSANLESVKSILEQLTWS